MTRKDYQLIAASIGRNIAANRAYLAHNPNCIEGKAQQVALEGMTLHLAYDLAKDNPRFIVSVFIAACGVTT